METTAATTTTDSGSHNRIDQFKSEVSDLSLKTGSAGRDRGLMIFGLVLMLAAVLVTFSAYAASRNYSDPRDIQTMIVLGTFMAAVGLLGAVLFLRYSLAHFLRMWLLRQLYEGQANTDRLIDAIERR
jgi:hypothetical protein